MLKTVLVPLDGSKLAERALPITEGLASLVGGSIILLRVVPKATHRDAGTAAGPEAEAYLKDVAARQSIPSVRIQVREGEPAPTILSEIAGRGVDLVAMSTHGRSGIGRWIYGSVADDVMRHSPVPVLLVPATGAARIWPKERPPRILVPLDFSGLSEAVLAPTLELARSIGAELILVSVTPMLIASPDLAEAGYVAYDIDRDQADRQKYLADLANRLRAEGYSVTTRVEFGFPNEVIVDVAQEAQVDLIAIATHGSGGVTRLLMGSTATGVVQRAKIPVLVVRPREVREEKPEADDPV